MAMGILGAYNGLLKRELPGFVFVGELMLDGSVGGIRGALPIAPADTSTITAGTARAVRPDERVRAAARFLVRHCAFVPCLRM
jgi:predicted ATPase with chaperone activity